MVKTKENGCYSGIEQLVDIMWEFRDFIQMNLKKQLAKANCLARRKREGALLGLRLK